MKEAVDLGKMQSAEERTDENFGNRKLIRPSLNSPSPRPETSADGRNHGPSAVPRRGNAEQTHAENFYYLKQIQSKTPLVIALKNGDLMHGVIEWYDRYSIKVACDGASGVLVYKHAIRYIHKAGENSKP